MESDKTGTEEFELTEDNLEQAYLYLKNYAYYDNCNFFLKQKIAEFEDDSYEEKIKELAQFLNDENSLKNDDFEKWLDSIDCYVLPKSVSRPEDHDNNGKEGGLVISNVTSSAKYHVDRVDYFISASVELHIIDVLWSLIVGPILEDDLSECCYGNRIDESVKTFTQERYSRNARSLFKYYVKQYGSWRDQALSVATDIHKNNENVALLSLDLKSYFYNIDLEFNEIADKIKEAFKDRLLDIALRLNEFLEKIFSAYRENMTRYLELTHPECVSKLALPIGFASSSVLGNWYLAKFDKNIIEKVRPDYYGRYVDDMIMVFGNPTTDFKEIPTVEYLVTKFLKDYLTKDNEDGNGQNYYIKVQNNKLPVQKDKLIYYQLEKEYSRAVLDVFKEELQQRSSAFRFLPEEEIDGELDRFAYDILYEGSHNKLRSIAGIKENATELAGYLARHIILHRLCKVNRKDSVIPQLERFFKGKNILQFSRLWEKVYQYAVVVRDYQFIQIFYNYLNSQIDKAVVNLENNDRGVWDLPEKLQESLENYNKISLGLSIALLDTKIFQLEEETSNGGNGNERLPVSLAKDEEIGALAKTFRNANLIRHHLVAWPLANFTNFDGDLTDEKEFRRSYYESEAGMGFDGKKFQRSPRFIHFEECQLFYLPKLLTKKGEERLISRQKSWQNKFWTQYLKYFPEKQLKRAIRMNASCETWVLESCEEAFSEEGDPKEKKGDSEKMKINKSSSIVGKKPLSPPKKVRIALANIKIKKSDIEKAIRKDKQPNISFERQKALYEIMNSAVRERADILVMPELSIPVSWLPFMASHCRKHQMAMIFGLEHWEVGGYVFNLLVELLPFKLSEKYKSCYMTARVKNHYAPDELRLIDDLRLKPPDSSDGNESYYNKVSWRGVNFVSYNCYELSDIQHRALFKSEIDILFACVCNKDTNYYQSILESAVRDMHCYVVQSNASQYGGSCVLRPAKTAEKIILFVKGGENSCVLITEIDVAALRDFQYKPSFTSTSYNNFKPLPPGFDSEKVLER